jgi:hypothetical protein
MGLGDLLQQAAGLGLAGVKGAAQIAERGLGMAPPPQQTGMFGAPAQYQDASLGDYSFAQNPIGNVLMRVQNAIGSSEGRGGNAASSALRQQRTTGNEQRLKAFNQGLELVEQMHGIRDRAGVNDVDRVNGLLKKRFAELAGGAAGDADQFYDTFMSGDAGHTEALLALAKNDAGAQQIINSGGTVTDLRKYLTSNDMLKQVLEDSDAQKLTTIGNKVKAITSSPDPALRDELEKRRKEAGGRATFGMLLELQEKGLVPPELEFTDSERKVGRNHEGELAQHNLQTPEEILKRREQGYTSQLKREEVAAELHQKHLDEMDLQRLRNKGLAERVKAKPVGKVMQFQWKAARYADRMQKSNAVFEKLVNDGFDRTSLRAGAESMLPNAVRSSERQQQDQAERDFVNAVLRDESGAVINPSEFESARKQYFPVIGDSKETVDQKSRNRQRVIGDMRTEAGEAWDRMQSEQPPSPDEKPPAPAEPGLGRVKMRFTDAAGKSAEKMVPAADIAKWEALGGVRVP